MSGLSSFFSSMGTKVQDIFEAIDMFVFNISLTAMSVVLALVCVYLTYSYNNLKQKLFSLNDFATKARSLGRVYSSKPFDEVLFEKLVMEALQVLRENVKLVSAPYFYAGSLNDIIKAVPGYVKVMRFAKYVYDHPDTKNDAVHKVLVKAYGTKYKNSPQLVYEVSIQVNPNYTRTYKHSLLVDMSKSQYVYKKNFMKANNLLSQADAASPK